MDKKILIIHNPRAGQKKKIVLKDELKKWKTDSNLNFDIYYDYVETEYGGHATELTKQAIDDGYSIVVAAGGDGTVNEIASALVNTNVALGILPMGSGNGLARHNNIPLNLRDAFYKVYTGESTKIDAGIINERYFFCAAGIGFDALVSEKFANSKTRGLLSYFLISLKEYSKYKSIEYSIYHENNNLKRKAFFITFANANQFGNHAYIAPQAKIDDGKLEVCILSPFKWWQGFSLAKRLFDKTIQKSKLYESFSSSFVKIDSNYNINYHFDGEIMKSNKKSIEVSLISKSLNIVV